MSQTVLPPRIDSLLAAFSARRRRLSRVRAAAWAIAAGIAILLTACLLDRYLQLPRGVRTILLLSLITTVTVIAWLASRRERAARGDLLDTAWQLESTDPTLGERLITVVSQTQADTSHRGSAGMLGAISTRLDADLQQRPTTEPLPWNRIAVSLYSAAGAAVVILIAAIIPGIHLPRLVARLALPMANIAPATTTQLDVQPGDTLVPQGQPLKITLSAQHAGEEPPQLHVRQTTADGADGDTWAVTPLWPVGADQFSGESAAIDRDATYFVTGGDAKSPIYAVHVQTAPALREVRATIKPPAYLHDVEQKATVGDQPLDVPVGSEVTLALLATEPLVNAVLKSDALQLSSVAGIDQTVRSATITADADKRFTVTLVSVAGVTRTLAEPIAIRVIPDRPPTVRLLVPDGELRLTPVGVLETACTAEDDHAVTDLLLHLKVNGVDRAPVALLPAAGAKDPRHIDLPIAYELAAQSLTTGDVLEASVEARDGAGQSAISDPMRVTISPRSFDMNAYVRLVELQSALAIATQCHDAAEKARHDADQNAESIAKDGDQMLVHLPAVASAAEQLAAPLLRAAARASDVPLADSIASWADRAERTRAGAEELADERARGLEPWKLAGQLDQLVSRSREIVDQLTAAVKMQQAAAVQDDLAAAKELDDRAGKSSGNIADKLRDAAKRLRDGALATARSAGLNDSLAPDGTLPSTNDAINNGRGALGQNPQMDFTDLAGEWSRHLDASEHRVQARSELAFDDFEPRLAAAAAIEAVRPAADYVRAKDLLLASRAADRLGAARLANPPPPEVIMAVKAYGGAMRRISADHRATRTPPEPKEHARITEQADAARALMHKWAGDDDDTSANGPATQPTDAMAQAIDQAINATQGKLPEAATQDLQKTSPTTLPTADATTMPTADPAAAQADAAAQRLQSLRDQQAALAAKSAAAARQFDKTQSDAALKEAAAEQAKLAQQIAQERQADAADQQPGDTQPPAGDPAAAIANARRALADLRQQNDAVRNAKDDQSRVDAANKMNGDRVAAAGDKLADAAPTAEDAKQKMDNDVAGDVRQMQQAANNKDANGAAQKANDLNNAINEAQAALDKAEEKLANDDALAAAQSAAANAADQAAAAAGEKPDAAADGKPQAAPDANAAGNQAANAGQPGGQKPPGQGQAAQANGQGKPQAGQNGQPANGNQQGNGQANGQTAADRAAASQAMQQAQQRTMSALDRAQSNAQAQAGRASIATSAAFSPAFSLATLMSGDAGSRGAAGGGNIGVSAAASGRPSGEAPAWMKLSQRSAANGAGTSETDAEGYGPAIKAYFDALSKSK